MPTIVDVGRYGRVTVPAAVRKALNLAEGDQLEVEVQAGVVQLRPVVTIPREDAWAYTPAHRALLERALQDVAEGRVGSDVGPAMLHGRAPVDNEVDEHDAIEG